MPANNAAPSVIESGWPDPVRDREFSAPSATGRAPLRLPIRMPLSEARVMLVRAGEAIALVTNRGVDVGLVTARDLVADGSTRAAVVGDVMGRELVCIDPHTDLRRTLRTYREAAWSSAIRRRPDGLPASLDAVRSPPTRRGPNVRDVGVERPHLDRGDRMHAASALDPEVH